MPVSLWNDPDGRHYRDAYLAVFPGVWRTGDAIIHTRYGSYLVIRPARHDSSKTPNTHTTGGTMDFPAQLDALQARVAEAKAAVQAAATESRDQLRQRIDQAKGDIDRAIVDAQQHVDEAADTARGRWAQLKVDAVAKMDDLEEKIDKRTAELDARAAATEADFAEADAADAIDYAGWAVDNARLAVLDAIDARAYADGRAAATRI